MPPRNKPIQQLDIRQPSGGGIVSNYAALGGGFAAANTQPQQQLRSILNAGASAAGMARGISISNAAEKRQNKLEEKAAGTTARMMAISERDGTAADIRRRTHEDNDLLVGGFDQDGVSLTTRNFIEAEARSIVPQQIDDPNSDDPDDKIDNPHFDHQVMIYMNEVSPSYTAAIGDLYQGYWDDRKEVLVGAEADTLGTGPVEDYNDWSESISRDEYLGTLTEKGKRDLWADGIEERIVTGDLSNASDMIHQAQFSPTEEERLLNILQERAKKDLPMYLALDLQKGDGSISQHTADFVYLAGNNEGTAKALKEQIENYTNEALIDEPDFHRLRVELSTRRVIPHDAQWNMRQRFDEPTNLQNRELGLLEYTRSNTMANGLVPNDDNSMPSRLMNVKGDDGKWYLVPGTSPQGKDYVYEEVALAAAVANGLNTYPSGPKKRDMVRAEARIQAQIDLDDERLSFSGGRRFVAGPLGSPIREMLMGLEPPDDEGTIHSQGENDKKMITALGIKAANVGTGQPAAMPTPDGQTVLITTREELEKFYETHYSTISGALLEADNKRRSAAATSANKVTSEAVTNGLRDDLGVSGKVARFSDDRQSIVRQLETITNKLDRGDYPAALRPGALSVRDALAARLQEPMAFDARYHSDLGERAKSINETAIKEIASLSGVNISSSDGVISISGMIGGGGSGGAGPKMKPGQASALMSRLQENRRQSRDTMSTTLTVGEFIDRYPDTFGVLLRPQAGPSGGPSATLAKLSQLGSGSTADTTMINMTMNNLWQSNTQGHRQMFALLVETQLEQRQRDMLGKGKLLPLEPRSDDQSVGFSRPDGTGYHLGNARLGDVPAIARQDSTISPAQYDPDHPRGWIYTHIEEFSP